MKPLKVPAGVAEDVARLPGGSAERYVALGINLRRNADGGLLPGSKLDACGKFAQLDWALDKPFATTGGVLESSVQCATRTPAMTAAGARNVWVVAALMVARMMATSRHQRILLREHP